MAFYYVRDDGTATGDAGRATSLRTGSFATMGISAFYANIFDVLAAGGGVPTTAATDADTILISSAHVQNYAASTTFAFPGATRPMRLVSVDDSNADADLAGASDGVTSGGGNLTITNRYYSKGVTFPTQGNFFPSSANCSVAIEEGAINFTSSGDRILISGSDGVHISLINSNLDYGNANNNILYQNGAVFDWVGGAITGVDGADLFNGGFGSGGGAVQITGVDLSNITDDILANVGPSVSSDDMINFRMHGCTLNATPPEFVELSFVSPHHYFLATNCDDTSGTAEHQFFQRTWGGDVEDSTAVTRDETTAFPGGADVSFLVVTVADCTNERDLVFDFPAQFVALATASTDTIRIFFTCANTLTDLDVWAELIYPDGTSENQYNYLTNKNPDLLAAGTEHTTDSASTWTSGLTETYQMDLDTSGDVGADSVPVIRIHCASASETIYFDTTVEAVA